MFHDHADQVSSVIHTPLAGSSVVESAHHYVYDAAGNIASKQIETPAAASTMVPYSHDSQNRLTAIGGSSGSRPITVRGSTTEPSVVKASTGAAGATLKNARMLEGNRFEADLDAATGANQIKLQAKDGSGNQSNYTYSLSIAAAAATVPVHDADGNLTSDGVRSYAWDSQSRLIKITWGGSPVKSTEYRYNALGQRSEQIELSGTTETARYYYLYDGIQYLCRYTGGIAVGNIDRRYLSQGEQRKTGSTWASYYYNRDHLGSIREVMNSDGSLAARYDYDPYGKRSTLFPTTGDTFVCDFGYTGHITQPNPVAGQTELVMTLFRAYDPELGRWLSADPIGEVGGMNLYGYVAENPVNNWDPLGLWTLKLGVGLGLGGFIEIGWNGGDLTIDVGAGLATGAMVEFSPDNTGGSGCDSSMAGGKIAYQGSAAAGIGIAEVEVEVEVGLDLGNTLGIYSNLESSIGSSFHSYSGELRGQIGGDTPGTSRSQSQKFILGAFKFEGIVAGLRNRYDDGVSCATEL